MSTHTHKAHSVLNEFQCATQDKNSRTAPACNKTESKPHSSINQFLFPWRQAIFTDVSEKIVEKMKDQLGPQCKQNATVTGKNSPVGRKVEQIQT